MVFDLFVEDNATPLIRPKRGHEVGELLDKEYQQALKMVTIESVVHLFIDEQRRA